MTSQKPTDKLQPLLTRLHQGVALLTTEARWKQFLAMQAHFRSYSFSNTMLILLQCPDATRVAGFRTWLKLGRAVKKGEKGIAILAPVSFKARKGGADADAADADADDGGRRIGFRLVHVFDVAQTEGEELPRATTILTGEQDRARELFDNLRTFAERRGITVVDAERLAHDANGSFSRATKVIEVKRSNPPLQRAKTLAHELGHALLHADESDSHALPIMEVEAESVAFLVLASVGLDAGDYSFGYVAMWMGGDAEQTARVVTASGNRITTAVRLVIDGIGDQDVDVDVDDAHVAPSRAPITTGKVA